MLPPARNLSPDDPRLQYERYRRRGGFSLTGDPRLAPGDIEDWEKGWREFGMGVIFSLRHDPELPPVPGDPYLP